MTELEKNAMTTIQFNKISRILEIQEMNQIMIYVSIGIGIIAIVIGIAILWNQRKIKKQLRELLEEKKQEE